MEEMDSHYNKLNRKLDALQSKNKDKNRNRTKERQIPHHFYTRSVNLTKIKFSKEETGLLNQGLQHSMEKPLDKYWTDLIMETEQAIRLLDTKMQDPYRIMATNKLKQIRAAENHHNIIAKRQIFHLKNIREKLDKENAMITKADKGKTRVVIYTKDYSAKVHEFLSSNNFQTLKRDRPNKYKIPVKTIKHAYYLLRQPHKHNNC